MTLTRLLLPGLAFTYGCSKDCPKGSERRDDGLCHLLEGDAEPTDTASTDTSQPDDTADSGDTSDSGDSGDTGSDELSFGDPILTLGSHVEGGAGEPITYEWVDAAPINDDWAIVVGQGGYGIVSMADGELVHQERERRALRVDSDGQHAILGTRSDGLLLVDVSPGEATRGAVSLRPAGLRGVHEGVAIDGSRILVGARDGGGLLLDLDGTSLGVLPASDAFAVGLSGDRAIVTDDDILLLYDITTPSEPIELARATMSGEGRDVSWHGDTLVVGMGGVGTSFWSTEGDALRHRGDITTSGSALSVATDGTYAWIGAWEVTVLVDLQDDEPRLLGHETPVYSALGVASSNGRAMVADWFASTALEAVPGVAAPEVEGPDTLWFSALDEPSRAATFRNHGPLDLEVSLEVDGEANLSEDAFTVGAYSSHQVTVEWTGDRTRGTYIHWTTNDPDEPTGTLALRLADQGVGTLHEDFTLPGIELPDGDESTWTLSDTRGKAVVLVYWALF